jgi:hypothetical protein
VYLVDVKGTHGLIDVYGSKWYPEGRQPFHSPLAKLRNHAKIMATIIRESNPGLTELRRAHVHATVLLTADDAAIADPTGIDSPDVTDFKHCLKYFRDTSSIPANRLDNISRFHSQIIKAIQGKAKPRSAALRKNSAAPTASPNTAPSIIFWARAAAWPGCGFTRPILTRMKQLAKKNLKRSVTRIERLPICPHTQTCLRSKIFL